MQWIKQKNINVYIGFKFSIYAETGGESVSMRTTVLLDKRRKRIKNNFRNEHHTNFYFFTRAKLCKYKSDTISSWYKFYVLRVPNSCKNKTDTINYQYKFSVNEKNFNCLFLKANTCFTGGVVFLEQGDTLHVQNMEQNRSSLKGQTYQIRSAREWHQWKGNKQRHGSSCRFFFDIEFLKKVKSLKALKAKIYLITNSFGGRQVPRALIRLVSMLFQALESG